MSYRETRSEVAAAARLHHTHRVAAARRENLKFRWSMHRETEKSSRDWYGFINLDRKQAQLFRDWLEHRLESPDYIDADGEICLLLSGWNNKGRNGQAYIGGIGGPSLSNKSLPNKASGFD